MPKAEDENTRVNEIIQAVDLFMNDVERVLDEINNNIEKLRGTL